MDVVRGPLKAVEPSEKRAWNPLHLPSRVETERYMDKAEQIGTRSVYGAFVSEHGCNHDVK